MNNAMFQFVELLARSRAERIQREVVARSNGNPGATNTEAAYTPERTPAQRGPADDN